MKRIPKAVVRCAHDRGALHDGNHNVPQRLLDARAAPELMLLPSHEFAFDSGEVACLGSARETDAGVRRDRHRHALISSQRAEPPSLPR